MVNAFVPISCRQGINLQRLVLDGQNYDDHNRQMTELLKQALDRIKMLAADRQNELAAMLIDAAKITESDTSLTVAQTEELRARLLEDDEILSAEDVRRVVQTWVK